MSEQSRQDELSELRRMADEYHVAMMDMALGISECFHVLDEVRKGNLDARVGEQTLGVKDELISNLGRMLNETVDEVRDKVRTIERQREAMHELSTPVLQLWDGVLALPVIGVVDTRRSSEIMERLLTEIVARQSRYVILDITGVEIVDTKTADHFIKVVKASELLGARCFITGIRPAVAQTLVDIGVDLSQVRTLATLHDALSECLRQIERPAARPAGTLPGR